MQNNCRFPLGTGGPNKTDEFLGKFQGGGGGGDILNPKTCVADFGPSNKVFVPAI